MSEQTYMNQCPTCGKSFFCEHKRDFRCPYCKIAELEAENARIKLEHPDGWEWFKSVQVDMENLENQIEAVRKCPKIVVWETEGGCDIFEDEEDGEFYRIADVLKALWDKS